MNRNDIEKLIENSSLPCGADHDIWHFGWYYSSYYMKNIAHYRLACKGIAMQYYTDTSKTMIDVFAPDPYMYLEEFHASNGNYSEGNYPYVYQPHSAADSTACYLGQYDIYAGVAYTSFENYLTRTQSGWIGDAVTYKLVRNNGKSFGEYFLVMPDYDGRGWGGSAWLTDPYFDGPYRTRWDNQGYHTSLNPVTNTVGAWSTQNIDQNPWNTSTGARAPSGSKYTTADKYGTSNPGGTAYDDIQCQLYLYLGAASDGGRKEIFPEQVCVGLVNDTSARTSSDRYTWGEGGSYVPVPSTGPATRTVQMQWLEGSRVSSNGKKLSELVLSKTKSTIDGLDCTMATGLPITKASKDGDVTIMISCEQPGKYIFYNSLNPSSTQGIEYVATGAGTIDTISMPGVNNGEYIFMKYLPNIGTELGYQVHIQSMTIKIET